MLVSEGGMCSFSPSLRTPCSICSTTKLDSNPSLWKVYLEDGPPLSQWLVQGVTSVFEVDQPHLGDLRSPWLLTTHCTSVGPDPPSNHWLPRPPFFPGGTEHLFVAGVVMESFDPVAKHMQVGIPPTPLGLHSWWGSLGEGAFLAKYNIYIYNTIKRHLNLQKNIEWTLMFFLVATTHPGENGFADFAWLHKSRQIKPLFPLEVSLMGGHFLGSPWAMQAGLDFLLMLDTISGREPWITTQHKHGKLHLSTATRRWAPYDRYNSMALLYPINSLSHSIHVWHIYLHLPYFTT